MSLRALRPLALVVALGLACGCSSSSGDAPASGDSGGVDTFVPGDGAGTDSAASDAPSDGGTTDAIDDAGGCNTLENAAPKITATKSTAAMPAAAGGTIADGTYFLTAETAYEAATAGPSDEHQETITITAGKLEIVKLGVTNPTDRTSWTYK